MHCQDSLYIPSACIIQSKVIDHYTTQLVFRLFEFVCVHQELIKIPFLFFHSYPINFFFQWIQIKILHHHKC